MKYKIIPYNTVEYANRVSFPESGQASKFYLDLAQMKLYSWSGTAYVSAQFRQEDAPTYHGSYLQPGYLEFSRTSSSHPIEWHAGDYIRYDRTGRIYRLYDTPQVERLAGTGKHGESFSYRNVNFYDDVKQLELCPFRNLVRGNGQYYYSSQQEIATADNVEGMAARIQANLDNHYGEGEWVIRVADDIPASFEVNVIRNVTVSGGCIDALNAIYETWPKLGWTYRVEEGVNTIVIGLPNIDLEDSGLATNQFSYADGLTALKRNAKSQENFCTRMFVYGTERNLINRYYNGKDIYNAANVYIPNLMLPLRIWGTTNSKPDASKAYLENTSAIEKYGLIVKDVYFDGTDGRPEVYSSIEDRSIANLKAAKESLSKTGAGAPDYYPQESDGTVRLDKIKAAVSMPLDNGSEGVDGSKYIEQYTYSIPSAIDSHTQKSRDVRSVLLTSHTFTESGAIDATLSGTITLSTQFWVNGAFAALSVYKGTSLTQDAMLKKADLELVSSDVDTYVFKFSQTIHIGSLSNLLTGEISVALEYGFIDDVIPDSTNTVTAVSNGASLQISLAPIVTNTFRVRTQQLGFDIKNQVAEGATLSMKSGMCAGRDFSIVNTEYDPTDDSWILTCNRYKDDSTSMTYPNTIFTIAANDEFVLTGITMPEEYILMSSERLYGLGAKLFQEALNYLPSYEPTIDSKKVYENIKNNPSDEQYKLLEGKYMIMYDADLFPEGDHTAMSMISGITISEKDATIPTYRVTLSDEVNVSGGMTRTLGQIVSQVHSLANQTKPGNANYYDTIPDGGSPTLPIYMKNSIPQPVSGIDVPEDIHSKKDIHADGGVAAGGIADLDMSGAGGGQGTVTGVAVDDATVLEPVDGIIDLSQVITDGMAEYVPGQSYERGSTFYIVGSSGRKTAYSVVSDMGAVLNYGCLELLTVERLAHPLNIGKSTINALN